MVGHREKVETKRGKRSTHKRRRGEGQLIGGEEDQLVGEDEG